MKVPKKIIYILYTYISYNFCNEYYEYVLILLYYKFLATLNLIFHI